MEKFNGEVIQAFPLLEGKVNLTSGTVECANLIHCAEEGSVSIEWASGTTATIAMLPGNDYGFSGLVTITSGIFHIA